MKKKATLHLIKPLLVLFFVLAGTTNALAQIFSIVDDMLCYYINYDENSATLRGPVADYSHSGELNIPESVFWAGKEFPVVAVFGFQSCQGITKLTIPNSVTHIGDYAFKGCTGLKGSLIIPNSVITIGYEAFSGCSGYTGSLNIPNSVTIIGGSAFSGCSGIDDIVIPSSVKKIGSNVFEKTAWFEKQQDGILYLDNCCLGYKGEKPQGRLVLNKNTRLIASYAFENCTELTGTLTIPNSVTTIGYSAFGGCGGFTGSLNIPNSVTIIEGSAFAYCKGFTGGLTIPNSVTSIDEYAFSGCSGFTGSLIIPNSVISIGDHAFSGCSGFSGNLTIPNSVTSIGEYAFDECSGIDNIVIPSSARKIVHNAFNNTAWFEKQRNGILYLDNCCLGYKGEKPKGSLVLDENTRLIASYAFYNCKDLAGSLTIPNSVTDIGDAAFELCRGFTGNLTLSNSVTTIGNSAFSYCSGFTGNLTIPNSVTVIEDAAFSGCSGFTGSLTIPNSVTTISSGAFSGCSGFTGSLTIPNSVTTIGSGAFSGCSGFTGSLTIPNSVTSIGEHAFSGCSGFSGNLTIPNSVTNICSCAFERCSGFDGNLNIGKNVKEIGSGAFSGCNGFTGSLTIPNSVTTIEDYAFKDCNGLNGVLTIKNPSAKIGKKAFVGCDNIQFMTENPTNTSKPFQRYGGEKELSVFHEGMAAVKNSNDKWGYIDRSGKMVIPCKYDDARRFSEGLAAVKKDGVWGYINKNGNTVIPFEYQNPYPFKEGVAYVYYESDRHYVLIDTKGNVLPNTPMMDDGFLPFSEGWAIVKPNFYKCYYIDKQGRRVTEDFDEARPFSEGLGAVRSMNAGRWGFIDKTGELVIPYEYTTARPFREGLAAVDGGYINKSGEWVIPPKYIETSSFENGLALVIKSRSTVCVIDKTGRELYSYSNSYVHFTEIIGFSNGIAAAKTPDDMGYNYWIALNTKCERLTKQGLGWIMLSYMDMKYDYDNSLLPFCTLANERLFPANKEDDLACSRRDGSKLFEKVYFYLDNQGRQQ